MAAVGRQFPRTAEEGREVLWPQGSHPGKVLPFRNASSEVRDHFDIPFPELASLAAPLVSRKRDTEQIVTHMKNQFGLGRLREGARLRFEAAIKIAREQEQGSLF